MTITNACYLFGIVDIFRENVLFLDLLLSPIFSSQKSISFLRYKEHTSLKWLIKKKLLEQAQTGEYHPGQIYWMGEIIDLSFSCFPKNPEADLVKQIVM